jgi:hypothetical protein
MCYKSKEMKNREGDKNKMLGYIYGGGGGAVVLDHIVDCGFYL